MPFDPVDPKQSLPAMELGILDYWKEKDIFRRSLKQRKDSEIFSFYDGPPFATGLPHYGNLLPGTVKDVITRYQTMQGKYVQRRFGWDCHGLPIENLIEKEHEISGKQEIEEKGTGWFNDLCRASVLRYTKEWRATVERTGRWVDMDWDYRTMDPEYMESTWWAFSELWKKKYVEEGHKPMHICPRCVTPLSNFEVTLGYKDVTDIGVTVKLRLQSANTPSPVSPPSGRGKMETFLLAWTTTPWTLPGNLFLAVHPDVTYVTVQAAFPSLEGGARGGGSTSKKAAPTQFILAKDLLEKTFKDTDYEIEKEFSGKELLRLTYEPLFPYFAHEYKDKAFRIVEGDFVTTDEGTGIVHIAPGYGADDYEIGEHEGVDILQHVTMEGKFTDEVTDFAGLEVKPKKDPSATDKKIVEYLQRSDHIFCTEKHKHSYPHCWRCDAPLLNYATSSWFVTVEKFKDDLLTNNQKTQWVPSHIRDGRFGNWLENARDWAISRNRYWGTPLPIWRSPSPSPSLKGGESCGRQADLTVISGRDELMQYEKLRFTKVTAMRHAESDGNVTKVYQSTPPGTDLTKRGREQAKQAAKWLQKQKGEPVSIIYCSPLARTRQTAELLGKITGAQVLVDDRLRETGFNECDGKPVVHDEDKKFRRLRKASARGEDVTSPWESWQEMEERICSFFEEILPKHRSEHIVIVSHGDPLNNIHHFFTQDDPGKIVEQPMPTYAVPKAYFWDHTRQAQMDLHKDVIDDILIEGSPSENSVQVVLMRHGETDWNKEGKAQGGEADLPLNDTGKKQAHDAAKKFKDETFDAIICSDMKRAVETAEIISKQIGVPIQAKWKELRERYLGEWGGERLDTVCEKFPLPSNDKTLSFHYGTPKDGESFSDFLARAQHVREKMLEEFAGKKILVVAHSGTVRGMQAVGNNLTYREALAFSPKNTHTYPLSLHPLQKRISDVFDCWFESGSMPYAQENYPYGYGSENGPPGFPADFIAESLDQTRGWFYTLMVLSTALFHKPAFFNCICSGMILAEDGKKMSKSLKNYPDPNELLERQGADALRFELMSSPIVHADILKFSEQKVQKVVQTTLLPLWNAYSFFVTYANAANFRPSPQHSVSSHPLDRWIRAELQDLTNRMTAELDRYDVSATCAQMHDTIDALTNWYIRLSRRRFAGKDARGHTQEQVQGLQTLYDVLMHLCQLLAPFCPYITEAIYLNLTEEEDSSIHLTNWPQMRELTKEEKMLLEKTRLMRLTVSLGLSIRAEKNIKTRQPLASARIAIPPPVANLFSKEDLHLLGDELNVKTIDFVDDAEQLAEAYAVVDARLVGPRLGPRVQDIIRAGKEGDFSVDDDGLIHILDETLDPSEVQITYRGKEGEDIATDRGIVICLDTAVTPELACEGQARDLIRAVQKLRQETGLSFTDRIRLHITGADSILASCKNLIAEETRSDFSENDGEEHTLKIGDSDVTVQFAKIEN